MVIAVSNQKGGVAKTTTAQAVAAILKRRGFEVLAIDFDPQGNLSDSVGAKDDMCTVYEILTGDASVNEAVQRIPGVFDIIPADIVLASAEQTLSGTGREYRLKEAVEQLKEAYDYIVIDTPPSLGILTVNAFTAADCVIVPTTAGKFAVKGIKELHNTVLNVKKYCNANLKIRGILFTKFDTRTNNGRDMKALVEMLGKSLDIPLYKTYIRNRVAVDEAQSRSFGILDFKGCEDVADDYNAFVDEFLNEKEGMS
jgi:chromosome partitioning protein